ncbi:MAG: Crp/Fnr family transcriptional regulator [Pseudomonadota bacterium]
MANQQGDQAAQIVDVDSLDAGQFPHLTFQPEAKVFSTGEAGDCLFLVKTGAVQIVMFGTILEVVKPGSMLGEMALIDGEPRSATAIATEPTELVKIDRGAFRILVQQNPDFALSVMSLMAKRLRQMNQGV